MEQSNLSDINGSVYTAQACDSSYSAEAYLVSYLFVPCTNGLHALQIQGSGTSASFSNV